MEWGQVPVLKLTYPCGLFHSPNAFGCLGRHPRVLHGSLLPAKGLWDVPLIMYCRLVGYCSSFLGANNRVPHTVCKKRVGLIGLQSCGLH